MLGTLVSRRSSSTDWFGLTGVRRAAGWLALLVVAGRSRWRSAPSINVAIEFVAYRRLRRAPKLAPLITAVGMSFIFQWFGLVLERLDPEAVAAACCPTAAFNDRRRPDRLRAS